MGLTTAACEQVAALTAARNGDGGWGYTAGRASRLEPTSLALLALDAAGTPVDPSVLARWPVENGLLIDPQSRSVNLSDNAVALLAALRGAPVPRFAAALVTSLGAMKGVTLPPSRTNRQDNALEGWPWVTNTFSWLEPTAWCVLALKKWTRAHAAESITPRISQGERLLIDRVCRAGGWNYGNSNVLGKELFAYIPTTAIALLALQDRCDHQAVSKSVVYLSARCLDETSGLSLSLARMALVVCQDLPGSKATKVPPKEGHGRANPLEVTAESKSRGLTDIDAALAGTWRSTRYLGNCAATALALYAEVGAADRYAAFRL